MSVFRPRNLNIRLVGTAGTIGGSPGNGGQIGPQKTPYCLPCGKPPAALDLGCRYFGGGASCCSGRFNLKESFCGARECCFCLPANDCKGFFICCSGVTKWFVAPSCTEVSRSWYARADAVTVANSCMGSCGWFVPSCAQGLNPGSVCKIYWDTTCNSRYWSDTQYGTQYAWSFNPCCNICYPAPPIGYYNGGFSNRKDNVRLVRSFRTV